jgi:predicted GIY-YIG superfamily endonuclease
MKSGFYCVYILRTVADPSRFYIGFTENLETRLAHHDAGDNLHTAKHCPWRIKTAVAFKDRGQALAFERYLKTLSGRAFAKKRL